MATPSKRARLVAVEPKATFPLKTINRHLLNFDFEKVCSVTLSPSNIYCCLTCGKYFHGKSETTPAFNHALTVGHELYIRLTDGAAYQLPDDVPLASYPEVDSKLEDIRKNLYPVFDSQMIAEIGKKEVFTINGVSFMPGLVGLNKIGSADYLNSVVQMLLIFEPLRDHLLSLSQNSQQQKDNAASKTSLAVINSLASLIKRMFNPASYKPTTSPQEFLNAVSIASKKQFFTHPADAAAFLSWLVMILKNKEASTVDTISGILNGNLEMQSHPGIRKPFTLLNLTLPQMPVIPGKEMIVPTADLRDILVDSLSAMGVMKISQFPTFLVLVYKRFLSNEFVSEKNKTVVLAPRLGLDLSSLGESPESWLKDQMSLNEPGIYDLVSCISHEGELKSGTYKTFVLHSVSNQWYEIHDLKVKGVVGEQIDVLEAYVHVYKLRPSQLLE